MNAKLVLLYDLREFLQEELRTCCDDNSRADALEELITRIDMQIVNPAKQTATQAAA